MLGKKKETNLTRTLHTSFIFFKEKSLKFVFFFLIFSKKFIKLKLNFFI